MHPRDVSHGISRLRHSFQRSPLNYMSSASIAADLRDELRKWQDTVNFTCEQAEESVGYKQKYMESLARQGQNVHSIQMHARVGTPDEHNVYDIVVLRGSTTLNVFDGAIYVTPDSVEHAVKIHYLPQESLVQPEFFEEDIGQLQWVDAADSQWLLVASNKNVFQHQQRDTKYSERAKEYREALEERCEEAGVHIEEIHP